MDEAEQAIRIAQDAVARARERLCAEISSLDRAGLEQAERLEAHQRVLIDVMDQLDANSPPVPAAFLVLLPQVLADIDEPDWLRKATSTLDRYQQALGESDNHRAMQTARDAIERAEDRLDAGEKKADAVRREHRELLETPLSELGLRERNQKERELLRQRHNIVRVTLQDAMSELNDSVKPVLAQWAETAALRPAGNASDALHDFRKAIELAATDVTAKPFVNRDVRRRLAHAREGLNNYLDWTRPEPGDDDYEEPGPLIGSRPPGPQFLSDDDDDDGGWRRGPVSWPASASDASVASKPPDVEALPEATLSRAGSDPGIPGPYDDLREPWLRRVLRRRRGRG